MSRIFKENSYDDEDDNHLIAMCVANERLYACNDDMYLSAVDYGDTITLEYSHDLTNASVKYLKENNREEEANLYIDYMRGTQKASMNVSGNKVCVASKEFIVFADINEESVTVLNFLTIKNGFKIAFSEKTIVTAENEIINLWSLDGKRLKQIFAHTNKITALAVNNNMIVSASENSQLRCWAIDGFFLKTISLDTKIVHVELNDTHLISYGIDKVITIRSLSDYRIVQKKTFDRSLAAISSSELMLATVEKRSSTVSLQHKLKGTEIDTIKATHNIHDCIFIENGKKLLILTEKYSHEADDDDSDDEDTDMQWVELWDISKIHENALELAMSTEDLIAVIWKTLRDPETDITTADTRYSAKYLKFEDLPNKLKERVKDDDTGEYECPILGTELKYDSMVALTDCKHVMSEEGLSGWLGRGNDTCPVCRQAPGVLKRLSRKQRLMEKILNEWEKKLNTARDNFLKVAKIGMSASDIMDYAKKHKDDIVLQDVENKADLAAIEVFKWQILVEKNDSDKITNKRARTGANLKGLPPIRIIRPNI